jgi:putative redox protein
MRSQKLSFANRAGQQLSARLDLPPDGEPVACALFAHCFTCTKNLKAAGNISHALTQRGIAVLRFDFTGLGASEGDFAETTFSHNIEDLVVAAEYMEEQFEAPSILIGHSLGGSAVLAAAERIPGAKAVATIGAPADPAHVRHLLRSSEEEIRTHGEATVLLAGRPFTIRKEFLDDLEEAHAKHTIANLKKALLVLHAPLDNTVGIDNAAEIFTAAKHPKSFLSLDDADHLLSNEEDSLYAGAMIAAWAVKYIDSPQTVRKGIRVETEGEMDERVVVRTESGYRSDIIASGHNLIADEPESVGGTNQGPTPYDYLLAALGSCTSITLRMYADRKKWPMETVTVRLSHAKLHAKDCAECESKAGKVDRIERELEFTGPLDEEQIARLVEIADKCPVHRTLHSEIFVKTMVKE